MPTPTKRQVCRPRAVRASRTRPGPRARARLFSTLLAAVGLGGCADLDSLGARARPGGFRAAWPGAGLTASIDAERVLVEATGPALAGDHTVELRLAGVGRPGSIEPMERATAAPEPAGDSVHFARGHGIDEWYVAEPHGLEQGFTVGSRPGGDGPLVVVVELAGSLRPSAGRAGRELLLRDGSGEPVLRYGELYARDAAGLPLAAELALRIQGAPSRALVELRVEDREARYPVVIDPLIGLYQQKLVAAGGSYQEQLGTTIELRGDTALLGAPGDGPGSAYVFVRSAGGFAELEELAPVGIAAGDYVGHAIGLEGDTAILGDTGDDDRGDMAGAAYVFVRTAASFTQQQKLTASDGAAQAHFGDSPSLDGDTLVVGAAGDDGVGAAYVFVRTAASFTQQQKLTRSDGVADDSFGHGTSLDGDTLVIGALGDDDCGDAAGAAYVFVRSAGSFVEQQKLTASDGAEADWFGQALRLDGDVLLLGAAGDDDRGNGAGAAYVFVRSAGAFAEHQKLTASDGSGADEFGSALGLSGEAAIVGSPRDTRFPAPGFDAGAAYLFARTAGSFVEQQKLTAFDAAEHDELGCAVALDGETALLGARGDGDAAPSAGAAYLFELGLTEAEPCTSGAQCHSGSCVDFVCCDLACGGLCEACVESKTGSPDGACAPVAAGTDPDDECAEDPGLPASCGPDGTCDGAAGCRQAAPSSLVCQPASCVGGTASLEVRCDGLGDCPAADLVACEPYVCDAAGVACLSACTADEDCAAGRHCDTATGRCVEAATCDGDHTVELPGGTTEDCSPYVCTAAELCLESCVSGADCVAGHVCDASGQCVPALPAGGAEPSEGCSCSLPARRTRAWDLPGLLLLAGLGLGRRARRGGRSAARAALAAVVATAACGDVDPDALDDFPLLSPATVTGAVEPRGEPGRPPAFEELAPGRWQAVWPTQRFAAELDGESVRIEPFGARRDDDYRLELRVAGLGRPGRVGQVARTALATEVEPGRATFARGQGLDEWYAPRARGLEQGFTIARPPAGPGSLVVAVAFAGSLTAVASDDGQAVIFAASSGEAVLRYGELWARDATGEELAAEMALGGLGAPGSAMVELRIDDRGARYPIEIDPTVWAYVEKLVGAGSAEDDWFGRSIALDGDTALVGAPLDDDRGNASGSAYVFVRTAGSFAEQQKLTASDGAALGEFGGHIELEGDTAVVGATSATGHALYSGSAYVFVRSAASFAEQQELTAADGAQADHFGSALGLGGDVLLVGASGDDDRGTDSGSAYLFVRSAGSFAQQQKLTASDGALGDRFGAAIHLEGDTALVGAYGDDDLGDSSGAAYVFVRAAGSFTEQEKLVAWDGTASNYFGWALGLESGTALIGAYGADGQASASGAAYLFSRGTSSFAPLLKLTADDGAQYDDFGDALALADGTAMVGAYGDSWGAGTDQGSAYVFRLLLTEGEPCTYAYECLHGHCADELCCDVACDGQCEACLASKTGSANGTCAPILAGTDPDEECGSGDELSCDGARQCKKEEGQSCLAGDECIGGHCADELCCDLACDGECEACLASKTGGTDGTCAPVLAGTDPDDECDEAPGFPASCGPDGSCGGTAACRAFAPSSVVCRAASCTEATLSLEARCDGEGSCPETTQSCDPYSCDENGTGCRQTCGSDEDCAPPNQCDAASGHCVGGGICVDEDTVEWSDGTRAECAPYVCTPQQLCLEACASAGDCVAGMICTAEGRCVAQGEDGSPQEEGCSCTVPGTRGSLRVSLLPALAALACWARGSSRRRRVG